MMYLGNRIERCFGYMFDYPGHGIYEPTFGKLNVSAEEARTHNQRLSRGEMEGLDKNCTVGLGGMFYVRKIDGRTIIATWLGEEVSREVQVRNRVITFTRNGMSFRGRVRLEEDCFSFKRIH